MDINELIKNFSHDGGLDSILSEETIPLLSSLFKIDERALTAILKIVPPLIRGEIDIRSLLPTLLPVVLSYLVSLRLPSNDKAPPVDTGGAEEPYENNVMTDIGIDTESIKKEFSSLELYLQNPSAS